LVAFTNRCSRLVTATLAFEIVSLVELPDIGREAKEDHCYN